MAKTAADGEAEEEESMTEPSSPRKSNASSSPEFEFWKSRELEPPKPQLSPADELFAGGLVLPLRLLRQTHLTSQPESGEDVEQKMAAAAARTESALHLLQQAHLSSQSERELTPEEHKPSKAVMEDQADLVVNPADSFRWKDIFMLREKKVESSEDWKKKERRSRGGAGGADININIWPFMRSRSAGNSGQHSKITGVSRKASSAPCSRSNSRGESEQKKRPPASPGRSNLAGGVHLGRSTPIWLLRRRRGKNSAEAIKPAGKTRAGDINGFNNSNNSKPRVPDQDLYTSAMNRQNLSCGHEKEGARAAIPTGGGNGSMFQIRTLFAKKVH